MLAEAAGDPSLEIRQLAIATLGDIGPAAKPVLSTVERAAKDNNASIAELAKTAQLRINGDLEDPPPSESLAGSDLPEWRAFSVDDLWRFLKSATPSTREKACYQLAKRKKEIGSSARNVIFELSARLKDDDEAPVRAAAAFAIGELGEPVPELARGLTDESMVVRLASSQALARLGRRARAFVRPLAQARVRDATSPVRRASGDALRRIEKDALEYLQSADSKERKNAEGLVQSVAQDSVRAFIDNLQKTDEDVRVRATLALGELGPVAREAVPQVIQLLKDEVPFVRIAAASTLANVGDDARKAKEELEKLIHDKDLRVRRQAREALARLDPRHPAVAQPKPAPPEPPKPPPAEPTATAPAPQEPQAAPKPPAASGSMASKIAGILDGEGGITEPSGESTGPETAVLNLALAHDRFDAEMAHGDAVRLSLKFFMNIQELQTMRVNYIAHNGKLLRIYKVTRAKASPFFEKLDDPFERRRARDWWSDMAERTTN
jgi:HEAT repeat protein